MITKEIKVGDEVRVKSGVINYLGVVENIFQNPGEEEVYYVINGHCYEIHELKKTK